MSLFEQSFVQIGHQENALQAFMRVIPYQFYPILALVSVPLWTLRNRDFGPMAKAQLKVSKVSQQGLKIVGKIHHVSNAQSSQAVSNTLNAQPAWYWY